jgi:hypothetical protein
MDDNEFLKNRIINCKSEHEKRLRRVKDLKQEINILNEDLSVIKGKELKSLLNERVASLDVERKLHLTQIKELLNTESHLNSILKKIMIV